MTFTLISIGSAVQTGWNSNWNDYDCHFAIDFKGSKLFIFIVVWMLITPFQPLIQFIDFILVIFSSFFVSPWKEVVGSNDWHENKQIDFHLISQVLIVHCILFESIPRDTIHFHIISTYIT